MKIALLGYGNMGKAIHEFCKTDTDHEVVLTIHEDNSEELTTENLQKADVAIDFSLPDVATTHIRSCFEANVPVVSGTTGWMNEFDSVKNECEHQSKTFFYSSNFSVGVNLFWKIVSFAGNLVDGQGYDLKIEETHHIHKKDAPSGTAITTAEELMKVIKQYKSWKLGNTDNVEEIPIFAHRKDEVPGTHLVTFNNDIEQIAIEHQAKSRLGFVSGAVKAAEFIQNKKGFYTMNDLLSHFND